VVVLRELIRQRQLSKVIGAIGFDEPPAVIAVDVRP
jgi:hypothetical protein